jgi:hypothetical protein
MREITNLGRTGTRKGLISTGATTCRIRTDTGMLVRIGSNIRDKLLGGKRKKAFPGRK